MVAMHCFIFFSLLAIIACSLATVPIRVVSSALDFSEPNEVSRPTINSEAENDDNCKQLPFTLDAVYNLTLNFSETVMQCVHLVGPPLQSLVDCDVKNPLLWTKCVLGAGRKVMSSIQKIRTPIHTYANLYKALGNELSEEYKSCLRAWRW